MINFLVLAAIVLVVAHTLWARRGPGYAEPGVLARDIGIAIAALFIVIEGAHFLLSIAWWRNLGQLPTYWRYIRIEWAPQAAGSVVAIVCLALLFRGARRRSGTPLARTRLFGWAGYGAAVVLGIFISVALLDPWTIALFLGARPEPGYRDPIFGHGLTFYMFRLPFYEMIFGWLAALVVLGLIVYATTLTAGASADRMGDWRERMMAQAQGYAPPPPVVNRAPLPVSLSGVVRLGGAVLLVLFAVAQWFARYSILYSRHSFLYGADYVGARWALPLYWVQIVVALILAAACLAAHPMGRVRPTAAGADSDRFTGRGGSHIADFPGAPWRLAGRFCNPKVLAGVIVAVFIVILIAPSIVEAAVRQVYVRPNEFAVERPYIHDHIHATRMAYDIAQTAHQEPYVPTTTETLDLSQYPGTEANIRLWDWQPFHENITQLQTLRPYYTFPDVDFDRYMIGGQEREVMIASRGLDTDLLPPQAQTWVNLRLEYTHGYGAVAALVNAARPNGQPVFFLKDAPTTSALPYFQLRRPQVYFGEQTHRAVFVHTRQPEFDYPKGEDNAYNSFDASTGIPVGGLGMRWVAAIARDDYNILLTHYFQPGSKLLLTREITARVQRLAPFLLLDPDPYLVVNAKGGLTWMMDAYTYSDLHPYSEPVDLGDQELNYIRNSVKITINAYTGRVHFYIFDPTDPVIAAYRRVFPNLFLPRSAMPKTLLAHIRYPETLFDIQAQIYRIYHMRDPEVFYNKEDKWDVAKQVVGQEQTENTEPYYVMLQLPGEKKAEFVLMLPFTPNHRDNLTAWLAARCDPAHYGELIAYRLPKDQLTYGPLQIESQVDQNRKISRDLSLWNQQGSRVIRGNTLVLPVGGTFLYVEPIYIGATQAHLPQLKKLIFAVDDRIVYANTFAQAVAQLAQPPAGSNSTAASFQAANGAGGAGPAATAPSGIPSALLQTIQSHMQQYRQLTAQGQLAAAGQELQAVDQAVAQALAQAQARQKARRGTPASPAKVKPPRLAKPAPHRVAPIKIH
ncbi:MAG: UPF0182 family protein [Terriglobales bacterium]